MVINKKVLQEHACVLMMGRNHLCIFCWIWIAPTCFCNI